MKKWESDKRDIKGEKGTINEGRWRERVQLDRQWC